MSSTLRKRRRTAISTLAMFVVVWLNMALQPCLMAASPILPDGHEHGDCPHCPSMAALQADSDGSCSFIDDFDFDGRDPKMPDVSLVSPDPGGRVEHTDRSAHHPHTGTVTHRAGA